MFDIISMLNSYVHAILGSLALIGGTVALIVTKGSKKHRLAGRVFVIGMVVSSLTTLVFMLHSILPLAILMAAVTLVLLFSALAAIKPTSSKPPTSEILLTGILLLISLFPLALVIHALITGNLAVFYGPLVLLLVFLWLLFEDWQYLTNPNPSRKYRIKRHLTRMILAYAFGVMALIRIGIKLGLSLELSVILPLLAALVLIVIFRRKVG